MPDFNPDREGFVKHKWIVQNATRSGKKGVQTSKGFLKYNDEGRLTVNDPVLAGEIREDNKWDTVVTRVRYPDEADRGHRYHFGSIPAMPWHKYDEFGRRIREEQDG